MGSITSHPTFLRFAWIGVGASGFVVLLGATWLAVSAQSEDPPPELPQSSTAVRPNRAGTLSTRPPRPEPPQPPPLSDVIPPRPDITPPSPPLTAPSAYNPGPPLRGEGDESRPHITPPLMPSQRTLERAAVDSVTPGRLSPEDLSKRREDRRARQDERLKERIKTLEERIQTYRQDGSRTEAQIERMERSLERMRQRSTQTDETGGDQ